MLKEIEIKIKIKIKITLKTYIITIHLQKLDGKRLFAFHQEGKSITTSGEIRFIGKKLKNIIWNITHKLITIELIDRIARYNQGDSEKNTR